MGENYLVRFKRCLVGELAQVYVDDVQRVVLGTKSYSLSKCFIVPCHAGGHVTQLNVVYNLPLIDFVGSGSQIRCSAYTIHIIEVYF